MLKKLTKKTKLTVLLSTSSIWTIATALLAPYIVYFVELLNGDILEAGYAYAGYFFTVAIFIGYFSQIASKKKNYLSFIVIAGLLATAGTLGFLVITNTFQLLLIEVILGIATAMMTGPKNALYTSHVDFRDDEKLRNTTETLYYIMNGIGVLFGGIVLKLKGFQVLFLVIVLLQFVSTSLTLIWRKDLK